MTVSINKKEVAMEDGLLMLIVMHKRMELFLSRMTLMKESIIVETHVKKIIIIKVTKSLFQVQNN